MKRLKKTVALIAAAFLCMLPILNQPIAAEASQPTTYYIKYLDSEQDWRYQKLSTWNDDESHGSVNEVIYGAKAGDAIIIDGSKSISLDFGVRLGTVTILNVETIVLEAEGIDSLYIHSNPVCAINSEVSNAYVYGTAVCNFNKNVTNLNILGETDINATVVGVGAVAHLKGSDSYHTYYEYYNFGANTLVIENGSVKTKTEYYSTVPSATSTPSAPAATTQPTTGTASGEYDSVPKTGDSYLALTLVGAAAVCLFTSYRLKRS